MLLLLNDEEWRLWSDREIARRCSVDNATVSRLRPTVSVEKQQIERKATRNGRTYAMNTAAIGRGNGAAPGLKTGAPGGLTCVTTCFIIRCNEL